MIATVICPGWTPASGERTMLTLGAAGVPNRWTVMKKRRAIFERIKTIMQDSLVRARRKIAAREGQPTVEINGKVMPAVTVNMDGVGAKRALNYNLNGSHVGVAFMVDDVVIDVQCMQNSDCGVGAKTFTGSVATAEARAVREIAARQYTHEVPLHIARVCSDADASSYRAVRDAQEQAGIPVHFWALFSAVICHDVRIAILTGWLLALVHSCVGQLLGVGLTLFDAP
jgi:hypothetical protein